MRGRGKQDMVRSLPSRLSFSLAIICSVLSGLALAAPSVQARPILQEATPGATTTPTASAEPTSSVRQPETKILGLRVEYMGAPPDWKQVRPSLQRVTVGTLVRLSMYVRFGSAAKSAHISVISAVHLNGRLIYSGGSTGTLARTAGGEMWHHWVFAPVQAGSYLVTGAVSVNGQKQGRSVSFAAVLPTGPAFTFDGLQALAESGRPSSSFAAGERVQVKAYWTVRSGGGSVPVTITETMQVPAGHGWTTLGKPLQNAFPAPDGRQSFVFSFVPGTAYRSMRVVIGVTIASRTQERILNLTVHA